MSGVSGYREPKRGLEPEREFHWLATVNVDGGRVRVSVEDTITAVPGVHTRQSTVRAILAHLKEQYGDDLTVGFLSLELNDLPRGGGR